MSSFRDALHTAALAHYQTALELCPDDDLESKAATLNNMAGVVAHQGEVDRALDLWNQSLQLKEQIGDVQGKATTLNNMADVIAQRGEVDRALDLWNQSLQLDEQIGDIQGKAATLNNMALVIADKGEVDRALDLWNQSFQLIEQIGDVQGKAITLSNMAYVAGKAGDKARQFTLNLQAAQALIQVRAYVHLVTVLSNLGVSDETNAIAYWSQALWLCLRIEPSLDQAIRLIASLFNAVPPGDELQVLLSATALYFCDLQGANHPQFPQFQEQAFNLLSITAQAQGIQNEEAVEGWYIQQQIDDPNYFLPRLNQQLETLIGDRWLFDAGAIGR